MDSKSNRLTKFKIHSKSYKNLEIEPETNIPEFLNLVNRILEKYDRISETNYKLIINNLIDLVRPLKIKLMYERKSNENYFKFVLSTNRFKANFNYTLVRKSNGLIFLITENSGQLTCKLLNLPINDLNPKFKKTQINYSNYDVYPIRDGTILNLYYCPMEKKWLFGTKNAFDISPISWRGYKYSDLIENLLGNYPEFNYSRLNPNYSYTIGFKHPAIHPFNQPEIWPGYPDTKWIKELWLVQITDLKSGKKIKMDIGIPNSEQLPEPDSDPSQKLLNSLDDYLKNKKIFLGFILRSKDENKTGPYSDLILESKLWETIRNSIYQLPFNQNNVIRERKEERFKNMNLVILDCYLDITRKNMFIELFPQFILYYKFFNFIIDQTVDRIYRKLVDPSDIIPELDNLKLDPEINAFMNGPAELKISKLTGRLIEIVKNMYQVTPELSKGGNTPIVKRPGMSKIDKKNIKSIISSDKYREIYSEILFG